jgi:hypothetical protein
MGDGTHLMMYVAIFMLGCNLGVAITALCVLGRA